MAHPTSHRTYVSFGIRLLVSLRTLWHRGRRAIAIRILSRWSISSSFPLHLASLKLATHLVQLCLPVFYRPAIASLSYLLGLGLGLLVKTEVPFLVPRIKEKSMAGKPVPPADIPTPFSGTFHPPQPRSSGTDGRAIPPLPILHLPAGHPDVLRMAWRYHPY